ncbi:probable plastid-lipid-associated protein 12, chloroplastic isoform X2 [Cryptomeria japonica]|uniref:probable plastid-lipid-associated protein 12, chloroplastic isoform X2 n=1 Tax=Cryptomeria japonica TaxID=3369 RepID=UPI0027DA5F64|nr:probable plastid-lipid-associated protein 12, chloroplastic isoform X2 [Cryptomeria japonica]
MALSSAGYQCRWVTWRSQHNVGSALKGRTQQSINFSGSNIISLKNYKCHNVSMKTGRISSGSLIGNVTEDVVTNEAEKRLIDSLLGIQGRGRSASQEKLKDVEQAIKALESAAGVLDPTSSSLIEGRWQLIFTTRPGSASPIQRTFVGVDAFTVFQEIQLRDTDDPRVSNIVRFSDAIGELKVEAAALIENEKRILFKFDKAAFSFKFLPFKVPYPVPFRLLGDEAKGWLDTTYLSHTGNIRISRGNKGTTFVLQKKIEPRQKLLSAISTGQGVEQAIDTLISNHNSAPVDLEFLAGKWRLLWTSQPKDGTWLAKATSARQSLQTVKGNGQLENMAEFIPLFGPRSRGNFTVTSNKRYEVNIEDAALEFSSLKLPLKSTSKMSLELLFGMLCVGM